MLPQYARLFRACLWLFVLILALRFALFLGHVVAPGRGITPGFVSYYTAARLVRDGAQVSRFYDDDWFAARTAMYERTVTDVFYHNPPTVALLLLPVAGFDHGTARRVLTAVSLLALAAALYLLLDGLAPRGPFALALVAVVLIFQPIFANFSFGQVYALLLALLAVAWHGYRRRQPAVLGVALGAMIVFKVAGALLPLLLLAQRRWRALAWAVASVLAVGLSSLPWLGVDAWRAYAGRLRDLGSRPELSVTAYQTQLGFIRHLLAFDPDWNPNPVFDAPAVAGAAVWLGFLGVVGVATYLAVGSARALASLGGGESARSGDYSSTDDSVFGAFVVMSVFLSPLALDYHYVLLVVPFAIVAARSVERDSGWRAAILALAVALVALDLPYRSPPLADGAWALLAYPKLYGAWLLWGLAVSAAWRELRGPHVSSRTGDRR